MRFLSLAAATIIAISQPVLAKNSLSFSHPATEKFMRQLDSDQLRIVRRAVQSCPTISTGSNVIRPERNPCVILSTDKAVSDSGDRDLQTFHKALLPTDRYDENRTAAAWMIWLMKN